MALGAALGGQTLWVEELWMMRRKRGRERQCRLLVCSRVQLA